MLNEWSSMIMLSWCLRCLVIAQLFAECTFRERGPVNFCQTLQNVHSENVSGEFLPDYTESTFRDCVQWISTSLYRIYFRETFPVNFCQTLQNVYSENVSREFLPATAECTSGKHLQWISIREGEYPKWMSVKKSLWFTEWDQPL